MKQYIISEDEVQAIYDLAFQAGFHVAQMQRFQPYIVMELVDGVYVEVPV